MVSHGQLKMSRNSKFHLDRCRHSPVDDLVGRRCDSLCVLRLLRRPALFPPRLGVRLGEGGARIDKLHDVDGLLHRHEGEADNHQDPRHRRVHLVGAGELERRGAEGIREDLVQHGGVERDAWLEVGAACLLDRLDQVG